MIKTNAAVLTDIAEQSATEAHDRYQTQPRVKTHH